MLLGICHHVRLRRANDTCNAEIHFGDHDRLLPWVGLQNEQFLNAPD